MQKGMFLHAGLNSLVKPKKARKQKYTLKKVIGRMHLKDLKKENNNMK